MISFFSGSLIASIRIGIKDSSFIFNFPIFTFHSFSFFVYSFYNLPTLDIAESLSNVIVLIEGNKSMFFYAIWKHGCVSLLILESQWNVVFRSRKEEKAVLSPTLLTIVSPFKFIPFLVSFSIFGQSDIWWPVFDGILCVVVFFSLFRLLYIIVLSYYNCCINRIKNLYFF